MTETALAQIVIVGGIIIVTAVIVYIVFRFGFGPWEDPGSRPPPPPPSDWG